MATISIDPATRDMACRELIGELDQHDKALQSALRRDPSEAGTLRVQADREAELLDALGWADDDARTRYELPPNLAWASWLKHVRATVEDLLKGQPSHELVYETLTKLEQIDRLRRDLDEQIGAVA
jgi:hypothetical protein